MSDSNVMGVEEEDALPSFEEEGVLCSFRVAATSFVPPFVERQLNAVGIQESNFTELEGFSVTAKDQFPQYTIAGLPAQRTRRSADVDDHILLRFANEHCPLEKLQRRRDHQAGLTALDRPPDSQRIFARGLVVFDFGSSTIPPQPRRPVQGQVMVGGSIPSLPMATF